ncbi:MAG: alanine racemase [Verrucomicrobia bacterium RIFCSPLOWO2_12_FULL_64_8]|nr:MAG: alanine racemase [Verrucomicrobia bacterium RIFCSPLOWO2_12_FULL_64_8]
MQATSGLPLRCWAAIDLAALERNVKLIRASLPAHIKYVAVVKADAYGHGLYQTATRLMHAGADLFAVANIAEAAAIREIGPGWPVLVLSPLLPEEDRHVIDYDLTATVSTIDEIDRLESAASSAGRVIGVHLKIDTGMGRVGVWHEEADPVFARLRSTRHLRLDGVFTHFSSADEDPGFTEEQRRRFLAVLRRIPALDLTRMLVHADNSAGLETAHGEQPFNAVRVGLLQFGILPHPHSLLARVHTEPVFSFYTRVGIVKRLPAGTAISYGQSHRLTRTSTVAVLCAGYGDGIARACSNRAHVLIHGRRCQVLGRVTMDQTVVDVTGLPDVKCGDEVVLVGRQGSSEVSIDEFSGWSDTIPWETLCSVTKRVPRIYTTSLGL